MSKKVRRCLVCSSKNLTSIIKVRNFKKICLKRVISGIFDGFREIKNESKARNGFHRKEFEGDEKLGYGLGNKKRETKAKPEQNKTSIKKKENLGKRNS